MQAKVPKLSFTVVGDRHVLFLIDAKCCAKTDVITKHLHWDQHNMQAVLDEEYLLLLTQ